MSDPLASSRRKVRWAKKHLVNLDRRIGRFIQRDDLYAVFTEPDTQNSQHIVYKMGLTKDLPHGLSELTGDIVDNLRAALDHAIFALSALKNPFIAPGEVYFPFARDSSHFERALKGRCKHLPKELQALIRSYQPYKGGSEALWALNQVCGANKHALIIPVGTATVITRTTVRGPGFISMPYRPIWDHSKQEIELLTVAPNAKLKANFSFAIYVAFGEIDSVAGKAATPVLETFIEMVESILGEIEAEGRRLGLIKP